MGLIATPRKSKDIRRRIVAAEKMLDESLASLSLTEPTRTLSGSSISADSSEGLTFRVKVILRELGHQSETEVAQRELYQKHSRRLQQAAPLKNKTDRRKLSEARILSGAQLIELRDAQARLTKDAEKGQKPPKAPPKTKRVSPQREVTNIATPTEIPGSPAPQISSDSEEEVLSDQEWNLASEQQLVSSRTTRAKPLLSSATPSLTTLPPLHMSLRSRKT